MSGLNKGTTARTLLYLTRSTAIVSGCQFRDFGVDNTDPQRFKEHGIDDEHTTAFLGLYHCNQCSFLNNHFGPKYSHGSCIGVNTGGGSNGHDIAYNRFEDLFPNGGNGGQVIGLGYQGPTAFQAGGVKIHHNLIRKWQPSNVRPGEAHLKETELISIKSNMNSIYNNVFVECEGYVSLRVANHCHIFNNHFSDSFGGVRIHGASHIVANNYFDHITCPPVGGAIEVGSGNNSNYFPTSNSLSSQFLPTAINLYRYVSLRC